MRILHSLVITPGLCGLYQTSKELIKAEEKLGHEVYVREPEGSSKQMNDLDITILGEEQDIDIIIDHSGCDKYLLGLGVPIIHMRHGRPLSSFLIEHQGGLNVYSHMKNIGKDPRYIAIVTFWKEHILYWNNIMNRHINYVSPPVDLEHYCPDGPTHNFGGKRNSVYNIVCADMWRQDECPFNTLNSIVQKDHFKLHIYGIQGKLSSAQKALFSILGDNLGEVGWSKDMAPIYRGADEVITCNNIDTRVVREALACGCPVRNKNLNGMSPREYAEANFDPVESAQSLINIAEECLVGN